MAEGSDTQRIVDPTPALPEPKKPYRRLSRRFILLTVSCSLVPLLLVGWGINRHYTRLATQRMSAAFENEVDHHRNIIALFLKDHRSKLQLVARTHSRDELAEPGRLNAIFELMNKEGWTISDMGLIGADGRHLAYIGPYDLMEKNYAQTYWFVKVMESGIYISDMFMGFRLEPHFVIAVTGVDRGEKWVLRATVDTEAFRSLVENVRIGETGEVYLLNREAELQTSPRFSGRIMEKADIALPPLQPGTTTRIEPGRTVNGQKVPRQVLGMAWLEEPPWLLVVKQDYDEALADVTQANTAVLVLLLACAATILVAAVWISRHMIGLIRKRDAEAEQLNRQLHETGKLASIGQLSAGVAHEINNPLAIITTEKQLLRDAVQLAKPPLDDEFRRQLDDSLNQIDTQVKRCKRITTNLLRFSRRTESLIEKVNLNAFIREVIDLMEREARSSGVDFIAELDENLPPILSDPSALQQVFLNLITNAIDAHEAKPRGTITIRTRLGAETQPSRSRALIQIADTGGGIPKSILGKIFDPFFTTKPAGKGTGLGLSICYSIIQRLGGDISVKSSEGFGTMFSIALPLQPPQALCDQIPHAAGAEAWLAATP